MTHITRESGSIDYTSVRLGRLIGSLMWLNSCRSLDVRLIGRDPDADRVLIGECLGTSFDHDCPDDCELRIVLIPDSNLP